MHTHTYTCMHKHTHARTNTCTHAQTHTRTHTRVHTHTHTVIQALVALVHEPEPEHPLRGELAEEFTKHRDKFFKNAEEYTRKHAEKRPSD